VPKTLLQSRAKPLTVVVTIAWGFGLPQGARYKVVLDYADDRESGARQYPKILGPARQGPFCRDTLLIRKIMGFSSVSWRNCSRGGASLSGEAPRPAEARFGIGRPRRSP
jgi:hypothetical protein